MLAVRWTPAGWKMPASRLGPSWSSLCMVDSQQAGSMPLQMVYRPHQPSLCMRVCGRPQRRHAAAVPGNVMHIQHSMYMDDSCKTTARVLRRLSGYLGSFHSGKLLILHVQRQCTGRLLIQPCCTDSHYHHVLFHGTNENKEKPGHALSHTGLQLL